MLHFIEHDKQWSIIEKMYNGLVKDGLMFLKINHGENEMYQKLKGLDSIGKNIYRVQSHFRKKGQIHYVRDPNEIKTYIEKTFNKEKFKFNKDATTVTILLRK